MEAENVLATGRRRRCGVRVEDNRDLPDPTGYGRFQMTRHPGTEGRPVADACEVVDRNTQKAVRKHRVSGLMEGSKNSSSRPCLLGHTKKTQKLKD
jgi:hypothetical protein